MSALQKLMFAIGVSDQGSGKLLAFQKSVDRTCRQVRNNFEGIKAGALSAAGAGMSLYQMVNPAVDFNRAVGEVRSLGTTEDALAHLQTSAKQFALQYGGSAAEVVRSFYDIQSAIAGLQGNELGAFTSAAAILAKGTKASTATITSYMGTMYGIYQQQADKMGKAQWVEQLAVLGMLQSTMGGSEAGTKYKAFLAGVGNAQKELGLKFTDKGGKMLGMEAILEKIKGKFGDELTVDNADLLKKAFGSDEAVSLIKLMLAKTGDLKRNIADIGKINSMDQAKKMAKDMTDVWARLGGAWDVVRITFASRMLPPIENVTEKLVGFLNYIRTCMDVAPGLTGKLGIVVAGAIALAGVMGVLGLVVAASKLGFLGLKTVLGPTSLAFKLLKVSAIGLKWGFLGLKFICGALLSLLKFLTMGFYRLALAMLTNPVTWIVLGILALVAAVVALVYYWSDLVNWFSNTAWGQALISLFQSIGQWWSDLTTAFVDGTWAQTLMGWLEAVMAPLRALGDGMTWVGEKLGLMSGEGHKIEASGIAALAAPRQEQILPGGMAGQISNATTNNGKTVTIGAINVQSQSMPSLADIEELGYCS